MEGRPGLLCGTPEGVASTAGDMPGCWKCLHTCYISAVFLRQLNRQAVERDVLCLIASPPVPLLGILLVFPAAYPRSGAPLQTKTLSTWL